MATTLFCILLSVVILPYFALCVTYTQLQLPLAGLGPESLAFETPGGNFFTGLADGRVVKYHGPEDGFSQVFAITSPQWSRETCLAKNDVNLAPTCGRPFGLAYNPSNRTLYIADAYNGLLSTSGSTGGYAFLNTLATSAEGQRFVFLDGLDIDLRTGILYFTDVSAVYDLRNIDKIAQTNDRTGRLMKYDPQTKEVTVLLRNLSAPGGVAVSSIGSSVFVSEFQANRIQRFWLTGTKANTAEVFISSILEPDNIKISLTGQLVIAAAIQQSGALVPASFTVDQFSGRVLQVVPLGVQYGNTLVSEVQPSGINVYVGSRFTNFVGVYGP